MKITLLLLSFILYSFTGGYNNVTFHCIDADGKNYYSDTCMFLEMGKYAPDDNGDSIWVNGFCMDSLAEAYKREHNLKFCKVGLMGNSCH